MADEGISAELTAALAVVTSEIDLLLETQSAIAREIDAKTRRQGLLAAALVTIERLEADGYPDGAGVQPTLAFPPPIAPIGDDITT